MAWGGGGEGSAAWAGGGEAPAAAAGVPEVCPQPLFSCESQPLFFFMREVCWLLLLRPGFCARGLLAASIIKPESDSVCVCVCIIHTHIYIHIHTHIHTYMCVCVCVCVIYIYIYTHIYIYIHIICIGVVFMHDGVWHK